MATTSALTTCVSSSVSIAPRKSMQYPPRPSLVRDLRLVLSLCWFPEKIHGLTRPDWLFLSELGVQPIVCSAVLRPRALPGNDSRSVCDMLLVMTWISVSVYQIHKYINDCQPIEGIFFAAFPDCVWILRHRWLPTPAHRRMPTPVPTARFQSYLLFHFCHFLPRRKARDGMYTSNKSAGSDTYIHTWMYTL